jgi:hypothetical protein
MALRIKHLSPVTLTSNASTYPLSATEVRAVSITIESRSSNTGTVSVGGSALSSTNGISIEAGKSAVIEYPLGRSSVGEDEFNLNEVYARSSANGDVIQIAYFERY